MNPQDQDRILLAMALVVDEATSLSLDSADDRRELKRRLKTAVVQAEFRAQHTDKIGRVCGAGVRGTVNKP